MKMNETLNGNARLTYEASISTVLGRKEDIDGFSHQVHTRVRL